MIEKNYIHTNIPADQELVRSAMSQWRLRHNVAYYDISTSRERMSPALSKTRTYHLRSPQIADDKIVATASTKDILEFYDTRLFAKFPEIRTLIDHVGKILYGEWATLGRVFVTKLEGNANIGRHVDEGRYFESLHRHHLVLDSQGSIFKWDVCERLLKEGDLVVVNNSIPHWVVNDGPNDRTHLIFDGA